MTTTTDDITKQLGPAIDVIVRIRMPAAFFEYILELEEESPDKFCSEELVRAMIAHLDDGEELPLKNYTIPRAIAFKDNEIMKYYLGVYNWVYWVYKSYMCLSTQITCYDMVAHITPIFCIKA
jgi:hypothetical protein